MEMTAFLRVASKSPQRAIEPTVCGLGFSSGDRVEVARGPLTGLVGSVLKQTTDGRWAIQVADALPGVLLCIDGGQLLHR